MTADMLRLCPKCHNDPEKRAKCYFCRGKGKVRRNLPVFLVVYERRD